MARDIDGYSDLGSYSFESSPLVFDFVPKPPRTKDDMESLRGKIMKAMPTMSSRKRNSALSTSGGPM